MTIKHLIYLCFLLFGINAFAQELTNDIDDFMMSYEEAYNFSGAVLVEHKGDVIYNKAFGFANIEHNIVNTVETKFRLASLTKTFTALLIMKLYETNKLDINSPISLYLDKYPISAKGKVPTIIELLNHSSGLPHYKALDKLKIEWNHYRSYTKNKDYFLNLISKMELSFEPGENHSYSSFGYILLGFLIEEVTGKPFAYNLNELICKPMNLTNTGFYETERILENKAEGYKEVYKEYDDGTKFIGYEKSEFRDQSINFSTGGVHSNLYDLRKLAKAFLNDEILNSNSTKRMLQPSENYGFGFKIFDESVWGLDYKLHLITMDGIDDGYNSRLSIINNGETIIILLGNNGRKTNTSFLTKTIVNILNDVSYPKLKKIAAKEVANAILNHGINTASQLYTRLYNNSKISSSEFYFSENTFNTLGIRLMRDLNMVKEAIQVFKWNVAMYPNSINTYDSLAEAYMKNNNVNLAIHNYDITLKKLLNEKKLDKEWITHVEQQLKKLHSVNN